MYGAVNKDITITITHPITHSLTHLLTHSLTLQKGIICSMDYAPNVGCRAEPGRFPLNLEIKTVIYSYMTRLSCNIRNLIISKVAKYAITQSSNFKNMCLQIKSETQMEASDKETSKYEMKNKQKSP